MKIIVSVLWFFEVIKWFMLARALISWLPNLNNSRVARFLDDVTEPLVAPVRNLISKTKFADLPIDISFIIVYLVIEVLTSMVGAAYGII